MEKIESQEEKSLIKGCSIIFYDGNCGLCHHTVQFVLKHDKKNLFYFTALQSTFALKELSRYQKDPSQLDTVYVLTDYQTEQERLLWKSQAAFFIFQRLGGIFSITKAISWLPHSWLDWMYDGIAKMRYQLFGNHNHCKLGTQEDRKKFLG